MFGLFFFELNKHESGRNHPVRHSLLLKVSRLVGGSPVSGCSVGKNRPVLFSTGAAAAAAAAPYHECRSQDCAKQPRTRHHQDLRVERWRPDQDIWGSLVWSWSGTPNAEHYVPQRVEDPVVSVLGDPVKHGVARDEVLPVEQGRIFSEQRVDVGPGPRCPLHQPVMFPGLQRNQRLAEEHTHVSESQRWRLTKLLCLSRVQVSRLLLFLMTFYPLH